MSERLSTDAGYDYDDEPGKQEELIRFYDQAVQEIAEEYRDKTPFEKQVMFELVMNNESKKRMIEEDRYSSILPASKERMKHDLEYDFDFGMNCGGFALEIFACMFPGSKSLEEATRNILEQFPFVRILDDTGLREGEYLVLYRKNHTGGHHFIKQSGDKFLEKDGSGPVQKFSEWPETLKDAPEIAFAVSHEHDIEPRDKDGNIIYSYFI